MGESLTQRRRVEDEGLRVVNPCQEVKCLLIILDVLDGNLRGSPG